MKPTTGPSPEGVVVVHFDGACEPPKGGGIATWAFTIQGEGLDHEEMGLAAPPFSPQSTNNVAEYTGAIKGLEFLTNKRYRGAVHLVGDSQLVIRQSTGEYRVKKEHLEPLHRRLKELERGFAKVQFVWVPREQNQRADELTKRALYEARRTLDRQPGKHPSA